MIEPCADRPHAIALGADEAYDAEGFVDELRSMKVTPRVAQNLSGRSSAIDGRTTRPPLPRARIPDRGLRLGQVIIRKIRIRRTRAGLVSGRPQSSDVLPRCYCAWGCAFSSPSSPRVYPRADLRQHPRHERVEVAAWKEKARQSERLAGLDVPGLVSDHKTAVELHGPMLGKIEKHARRRLAPVMFLDVAGHCSLRVMRAEANVIDPCAVAGKFATHPVVQLVDVLFSEE